MRSPFIQAGPRCRCFGSTWRRTGGGGRHNGAPSPHMPMTLATLPTQHAQRVLLHNEVHAR
ncbi:MAG TPA: hypothetical protein PK925_11080, partial [Alicycliphilus sp.]|nr:hypothetical protein [Alicycliphilus sp.]